MNAAELFALIQRSLADLHIPIDSPDGRRVYLAFLAAQEGLQSPDESRSRKIAELRQGLGL